MTEEVTVAETAQESQVKKEPDAIVEEAVVTEEDTSAITAPESPVNEPEAIVKDAIVREEVTEAVVEDSSCCRS